MTTKHVRVEMKDGSKWDVPLDAIAKNYVENHPGNAFSDAELLAWAEEMTWNDVHEVAVMVSSPDPDRFDDWLVGPKTIVEKDAQ